MAFDHTIDDRAGLRRLYAEPHKIVADKAIDHVDEKARAFLARAPFVALATTGPNGTDVSPRGGPPGFVAVIDANAPRARRPGRQPAARQLRERAGQPHRSACCS